MTERIPKRYFNRREEFILITVINPNKLFPSAAVVVQLQRFIKYTSYLRGVKAEKARNDELQVRLQALEARIQALEAFSL